MEVFPTFWSPTSTTLNLLNLGIYIIKSTCKHTPYIRIASRLNYSNQIFILPSKAWGKLVKHEKQLEYTFSNTLENTEKIT